MNLHPLDGPVKPDLAKQEAEFSKRLMQTLSCLREWHILSGLKVIDPDDFAEEVKPYVKNAINQTREILSQWGIVTPTLNEQETEAAISRLTGKTKSPTSK